jgi:para-nitrobenzyl esterase
LALATGDELTIEGGKVSGVLQDGVRVYKGIPYAAPPVGELRWKPPQPVVRWEGVRSGSEYGPDCPQAPYPRGSIFYSAPRQQSEDCLCLNVWTAARAGEKRPVMVWIHGGALTRGSGAAATYDGRVLAQKGVVVVTINYRLGVLGYFAHPELTAESPRRSSGNYGVLDQLAALNWVSRNIAAFGGDSSKVTIFGESAGAWSVNALVASPLGRGLFHRAIGQSGGSFGAGVSLAAAERMGAGLAKRVKAESLAALRGLPAEGLVEAAGGLAGLRTTTIVDGWVLPEEIRAIFARGRQNDVPVIVGSNANEMTSLTAPATIPQTIDAYRQRVESQYPGRGTEFDRFYPVAGDEAVPDAYLDIMRDVTFTVQMRTWARMTATGRSKAFWYYFTHSPPIPNSKYMRAFHAAEIAYVFGNINRFGLSPRDTDRRLSETMAGYWVNFAKTGDPNGPGLPAWPVYNTTDDHYLELGPVIRPGKRLLRDQLDFLEKLR